MNRLVSEPRMIEIQISDFRDFLENRVFCCINRPRKGDILIDMTFSFIFVRDFQENVFIKVLKNREMVRSTIS